MMGDEPWDGTERRSVPPDPGLSPATIAVLDRIHDAIADDAEAKRMMSDALTNATRQQGRWVRIWLATLTVAVLGLTVNDNAQGRENFSKISEVASCTDVGGECFERIAEREKVVTDADRKLLAQEIICYVTGRCPDGMDRNNIPDLEGLPPPPEEDE